MKNKYHWILLSLLTLSGCMHTVTGVNYYFPPGSNPSNSEYHLWLEVHGASGKAFADRTKKKVIVGIQKGKDSLLLREYELTAASLESDVTWATKDNLKITLFDFDEGVNIYDRANAYKSGKILLTLNITFDPKSGQFIESPISEELKQKIKTK